MPPRQYDLHENPESGHKFDAQLLKVDPMGCGTFSTLHSLYRGNIKLASLEGFASSPQKLVPFITRILRSQSRKTSASAHVRHLSLREPAVWPNSNS